MALDLDKRTETLKLVLSKRKIASIRTQVASLIDRSGSMNDLYRTGVVQEYVNRLIPLGLRFDDNGSIDNWAFHTSTYKTDAITLTTVDDFVRKNIMPLPTGGTEYAQALEHVRRYYFEANQPSSSFSIANLFRSKEIEKPSVDPVYLIFQTDGENSDPRATDTLLSLLEKQPIYIQFVGVGNEKFSFISKMADKYSNVGFFTVRDLSKISDDELYDLLINEEFKTFLKTRFPNNITEIL